METWCCVDEKEAKGELIRSTEEHAAGWRSGINYYMETGVNRQRELDEVKSRQTHRSGKRRGAKVHSDDKAVCESIVSRRVDE